MKIERSQITKLLISDLMGEPFKLDPVTVYLEDLGSRETAHGITRQGKITIECFGKSWSSNWGGMGDRTVAQFFCDEGDDYLIGCLSSVSSTKFSGDALVKMARQAVLDCRRGRTAKHFMCSLGKEEAAQLWNEIEDLESIERDSDCWHHSELLTKLFGEEWFHAASDATEPNHHYTYLQRIVLAVQEGLRKSIAEQAAIESGEIQPVISTNIKVDHFRSVVGEGYAASVKHGVRVKHLPTGNSAARDNERSQHMNLLSALADLRAMLPAEYKADCGMGGAA